jgi:hypothetical protein
LTHWAAWSSQTAALDVARVAWMPSGTCGPATCQSFGVECGTPTDGCGGNLSCGGCANDQTCDRGVCVCARESCLLLGVECGSLPDGCGGTLACGECPSGQICSDGTCLEVSPTPPTSCMPESCVSLGMECDTWPDGCGGTLSCGGCASGQSCANGVCVEVSPPSPPSCVPDSCKSLGIECGSAGDGCGATLNCGGCASGQACNSGVCVDQSPPSPPPCAPDSCWSLGIECGSASDGCGATLNCGGCASGQACNSGVCVDVSPPGCLPETCLSLGLECGQASDGCGGTVNCGSCIGGANVLWSSTEQTQGFPFNFDWTTCEKPIASVVGCRNGDGDGAEFDIVADPAGGSGLAIRQYANLQSGGGRSQGAVLSQVQPAIDALYDNQEEIWIYTEYYFPARVVGSGWLHFLGLQQTGAGVDRVANNPAMNFWSEDEYGGGYYPGDMEIGINWVGDTQLQKATAPLPVGKWTEYEFMYKRSSGNNAKDGAAQIWIDNVLVVNQTAIETWQNGHGDLEIYWNLYGDTWSADWNDPSPEHYIRNLHIGDAKMSTGYLR